MLPRISVVIPNYKSAEWIEATLESVHRQTYPGDKLEIVVVDDASPDESGSIARQFLENHGCVGRVVRLEKNGGVTAARNFGWRLGRGDWIQFLDQDDLLAPHKIALQANVAAAAGPEVGVVYSNWQNLELINDTWAPSGAINMPFVDDDPVLQILEDFSFGCVGSALIRKASLEMMGGFDARPNLAEDCDLMLRLAMAGVRFVAARSEEAAFLYRQSPGGLSRSYLKNQTAMRNSMLSIRRVEEYWRGQPDGSLSHSRRQALARRYSRFASLFLEHDPEFYSVLKGWLEGLGYEHPI